MLSKTHKFFINTVTISAMIILFSLSAIAQPMGQRAGSGMPGQEPFMRMDINRMAERLNLNDQQRIDITSIIDSAKLSTQPIRDAMQANKASLDALLRETNPSQADIEALVNAQGSLHTENMLQHIATRQSINALLTPEQRIQLQTYQDIHRDMHKDRRGNKPGHPRSNQDRPCQN